MKLDMHCHTHEGSVDSKVGVEEYIRILKEKGYDGMLITDHDTYNGYRYWKEHLKGKKYKDFVVLKGIEYDTNNAGHMLVVMPENVKLRILEMRGMPLPMLLFVVHAFGGIVGPAHPFGQRSSSAMFFKKIKSKPEILQQVDFIEGFNTCEREESNRLASALASKLGKPCTGGSDAHNEAYVGMAYTLFDREITCNNDLIAAIREGQIVQWGGQVRSHTRKAEMKDAFYSVWGFKVYNRGLGFLFAPYRKYRMHKLKHAAAER